MFLKGGEKGEAASILGDRQLLEGHLDRSSLALGGWEAGTKVGGLPCEAVGANTLSVPPWVYPWPSEVPLQAQALNPNTTLSPWCHKTRQDEPATLRSPTLLLWDPVTPSLPLSQAALKSK